MVLRIIYILNMEKIKINCPDGYEVDKDKSTFEEIVFKVKIPEYVECINETTSYLIKGRVYKCSPKMSGKHYVLTCNLKCGGYEVGSILYAEIYDVKPSTKEAFDEQNRPKFKEGDWVVVTDAIKQSAWSSRDEAVGYIFQLVQGSCIYTKSFEYNIDDLNKSGTICCPDNKYLINYKKEWLRLATPEEVAKAIRLKLPTKWEEVSHYSGCLTDGIFYSTMPIRPSITNMVAWPTREYAKASIALCKLIRLRDIYNDGWIPDWSNPSKEKYNIYFYANKIECGIACWSQRVLSFKSEELRDEFLKNFKELIEEAKLLL